MSGATEQPHLGVHIEVRGQLSAEDIDACAGRGVATVVCLRPDDEDGDYPTAEALRAHAEALGLRFVHAPVPGTEVTDEAISALEALQAETAPAVAYCRSGRRVALAWAMARVAAGRPLAEVLDEAAAAGFDLQEFVPQLTPAAITERRRPQTPPLAFEVVVVGGGSAGLATIASLRRRRPSLSIALVEPSAEHHYQPGLTLVGSGWFDPARITRPEETLIPDGVTWLRAAATGFEPDAKRVVLADGRRVAYDALVLAPGLTLDWSAIEGVEETLGDNGVCSNYLPRIAPYTWECVRSLRRGTALFTQPAMPIKCAGAPQKALYLACDRWRKAGVLGDIDVRFHNTGAALFGVEYFVPSLMKYVERYGARLCFESTLVAVDGPKQTARFRTRTGDDAVDESEVPFDFLHVVPPQRAPDCIAGSSLADASGWVEVDPHTLAHVRHADVFAAGDVVGTTNAKTMAAARKHAPIVAENLLARLDGRAPVVGYDGYGACPLTVEGGKVVLAEFGYGGKLLPTFPLEPAVPRRLQWWLKRRGMPVIYWELMLKGREWYAGPGSLERVRAGA